MNKGQLLDAVAEAAGLTKVESGKVVSVVFDVITRVLSEGDKVQITDFGTFSVSIRKARKGMSPATREEIHIPECKIVKFKASKKLKEDVN